LYFIVVNHGTTGDIQCSGHFSMMQIYDDNGMVNTDCYTHKEAGKNQAIIIVPGLGYLSNSSKMNTEPWVKLSLQKATGTSITSESKIGVYYGGTSR
jgi:hypothetical protein